MERSYKQFEVSVIKLKARFENDKFLSARIKLTFFYSLTVAFILGAASFLIYKVLMSNLFETLRDDMINPIIAHRILDKAQIVIQNRLFTIDMIILCFVVLLSFFLTEQTLKPIQKSALRQKRFIADASHELRTPVAVIISGLEVALRNKNLNVDTAKEVLKSSLEEMKEFSLLSNTLLDISKYDNNLNLEMEELSTKDLLLHLVNKMEYLAQEKNISIKTNLENTKTLKGNKLELSRVIYNVLNNAITYTKEGGEVIISDLIKDREYILSIKDNGVGISKEILEKVFEPFFRGDSSRNTNGAGLGLTISKKIIDKHKGSMNINSELGKGTEVIITIPIN